MNIEATSNFNDWLNQFDFSDYNDVYDLYHAVNSAPLCKKIQVGMFSREVAKGGADRWIVKYGEKGMAQPLRIPSEKARHTFRNIIEEKFCEGMGIEGFYEYHKSMEKED